MSWIDDAKKQGESLKTEEERNSLYRKNQEEYMKLQKIALFQKLTYQAKVEIEKVLDEAKQQGLVVSSCKEGYQDAQSESFSPYYEVGSLGNYLYESTSGDASPSGDCGGGGTASVYYSEWKIKDINKDKSLRIRLGITEVKEHPKKVVGWWLWKFEKVSDTLETYFTLTVSAQEVEREIKNWLVKIYSK